VSAVRKSLAESAYALFALEQPLPLDEIAVGARVGAFPSAATHTPEWFSAAAGGSDLMDMAPELQVLPIDLEQADLVDLSGIDLIHVYAPEMHPPAQPDEPTPGPPAPPVEKPRTSLQLGLLKELGNLDD
jgi:hypothetical protein